MPLYLPRNVAGLVGLANRQATRFALDAVRVLDAGNGLYRVEATDGKALGIIQGPSAEAAYPLLEEHGEPGPELLVPGDAWRQAFKLGDKRRPVGIGLGAAGITLAVGDRAVQVCLADGR